MNPCPAPIPQQPDLLRIVIGTQVISLLVAAVLIVPNGAVWLNLVYSLVIGNITSLLINGSRLLLARWLRQRWADTDPALAHGWMGWKWVGPLVVVCGVLGYHLGMRVADWITGHDLAGQMTGSWKKLSSTGLITILASLAITWFFYSRAKIAAAETHAAQVARLAAQTQLKLLESQLEPHMLFNTLANLRALIALDPPRAQQMLDQLIDFLRATLSASRATLHPLSAEFSRLGDYLALMQVRMGSRLHTTLDLPEALAHQPVPPLLLQPLVENAIKHGLEPQRRGGRIHISAYAEAGRLWLRVDDTGGGLPDATADAPPNLPATDAPSAATAPHGGFGTTQVRERLRTLYGEQAGLVLEPRAGGGTRASVWLPLDAPPT